MEPPAHEPPSEEETPPRLRRTGGVTVHDVAKLASVSAMTVSRAINAPDTVSPSTLSRVQEAIASSGYVPNLMAGGLRSARSKLVAAIVPSLSGVFSETVQALTDCLGRKGYHLILGQSGFTPKGEEALIDAIIGRRPDGIVLTGVMASAEGRRRLIASGIPVVETWDLVPEPIDMLVGFSHDKVGFDVGQYLVGRGRRRFAVVCGSDNRAMQRKDGLSRAVRLAGLPDPQVEYVSTPTTHEKGRVGIAAVLERAPDTDAVFCGSDVVAMGVLTEAAARGLRVPEQLAVIGHGDLNFAASLHPKLTTVHIDYDGMGRIAAQFIIDRAEGRQPAAPIVDIGFGIVERESA